MPPLQGGNQASRVVFFSLSAVLTLVFLYVVVSLEP